MEVPLGWGLWVLEGSGDWREGGIEGWKDGGMRLWLVSKDRMKYEVAGCCGERDLYVVVGICTHPHIYRWLQHKLDEYRIRAHPSYSYQHP